MIMKKHYLFFFFHLLQKNDTCWYYTSIRICRHIYSSAWGYIYAYKPVVKNISFMYLPHTLTWMIHLKIFLEVLLFYFSSCLLWLMFFCNNFPSLGNQSFKFSNDTDMASNFKSLFFSQLFLLIRFSQKMSFWNFFFLYPSQIGYLSLAWSLFLSS